MRLAQVASTLGLLFLFYLLMNIIIWIHRGVSCKAFTSLVKDLTVRYKASFLCLLETHVGEENARKIVRKFNFDGCYIMDGIGS